MCGVYVSVSGLSERRASGQSVHDSLQHRGPDSFGYEAINVVGRLYEFGHTRLAIRDLSPAGHQPMRSADGRWLLSYNGELYNNDSLRRCLSNPFRGSSDTETLLELITRYGVSRTLAMLNGMYAFVALDTQSGVLYAARDPSGIKPLYFEQSGSDIAFSSEIRGLRDHGMARGEVDRQALATYLRFRYVPAGDTLIKGVKRVSAGELIQWQAGEITRSRFTAMRDSPSDEPIPSTIEGAATRLGQLFDQAVARQMVSDVPVGVLLSGGIDSAIVASALRHAGIQAPCFTVGFANDADGVSEISAAAETASVLGLPHHALSLSAGDLARVSLQASAHLEEPLGTTSILAMWHLCALARSQVTVALAGQGADEHLGGYRRHRLEALRAGTPEWAAPALGRLGHSLGPLFNSPRLRSVAGALSGNDWLDSYAAMRVVFDESDLNAFGLAQPSSTLNEPLRRIAAGMPLHGSSLSRSLALDAQSQLADDLLLYGDKVSMAHSLEVRVPFLDEEMVGFMSRLPDHYKVTSTRSKIVLREYARRSLPESIIRRPKRGFQIPNLFKEADFLKHAKDITATTCGHNALGLNTDAALAVLDEAKNGGTQETRGWTLYSLSAWYQTCMK